LIAPPVIHFKGNGFYKTDSVPPKKDERKSEETKEGKPQKKDEKKPKKKDSTKTEN
jgi:predicted nucleic acid-binding Zn ribbon protein